MRHSIWLIMLLSLFWLGVSVNAQEQSAPPLPPGNLDEPPPPEDSILPLKRIFDARFVLEVKDEIGLSDEQVEKIEELLLTGNTAFIRRAAEIKIKELKLAVYLNSGKIDRKETETRLREIGKDRTEAIIGYMNLLLDIRQILTPTQFKKLKRLSK